MIDLSGVFHFLTKPDGLDSSGSMMLSAQKVRALETEHAKKPEDHSAN
jgi:hypothetical protein